MAAVKRKKVDAQKLASQAGRTLQRLEAHKYFTYQVDPKGQLQWARKEDLIAAEAQQDGWYLLHTNKPVLVAAGAGSLQRVTGHRRGVLRAQELPGSPPSVSYHWRPDRVINHVRLCFLSYWISARLGGEWRAKGETQEVPRTLRQLQTIRLGTLKLGATVHRTVMTNIPKNLNDQLRRLRLASLFAAPPSR